MRGVDLLMFGGLFAFAALAFAARSRWRERAKLACIAVAGVAGIAALAFFHWQAVPGVALAVLLLAVTAIRLRVRAVDARWCYAFTALLLVMILGCAAPYYFYPLVSFPKPDGPFPIGVRDFDLTRPRGIGADASSEDRHLLVRAWFPAGSVEGLSRRRYFTREEALAQLPNYQYLHLYDVRTAARVNAAVRMQGGPWPVVIFNHGYMSYIGQNAALMEQLASHGYVVFSISHPHDGVSYRTAGGISVDSHSWAPSDALVSALQTFIGAPTYEGRYAGYEAFRSAIGGDRLARSVADWRDDDLYLANQLASRAVPAAVADIAAQLDLGKLAYAGMSFGGGTAATACQADARCRAVVSLDGVNWDLPMFDANLRAPLLFLQSDWLTHPLFPYQPKDPDTNPQDLAYERWADAGLRRDVFRYRIENVAHLGMMDLTLLARSPLRDRRFGEIDGETAIAVMNAFTLGFLDATLRGRADAFPAAPEARYPQARQHRADGVRLWWRSRPP